MRMAVTMSLSPLVHSGSEVSFSMLMILYSLQLKRHLISTGPTELNTMSHSFFPNLSRVFSIFLTL